MTKQISPELVDRIINQREEFRRVSMKNILDRLLSDDYFPVYSRVSLNPTSVPDDPSNFPVMIPMNSVISQHPVPENWGK